MTAADQFLGQQRQEIVDEFDRQWQAEHAREWRQQHDALRRDRERLAQLTAIEAPTAAQTFERGQLTERKRREEGPDRIQFEPNRRQVQPGDLEVRDLY